MSAKNNTAVGVDGCRGGWVAAICSPGGSIQWMLTEYIQEILDRVPHESTVLVDMIIGLPDATQPFRECDRLARKLISPHGSRVFPAPPREALAAQTYEEACRLARAATGKAISKQCWHLFPKIRELDSIKDLRIRESHPELIFARFNKGHVVTQSKKSTAGQQLRLDLLETALPGSISSFEDALKDYPRKAAARDDLIDALALCAGASRPKDLKSIPDFGAASSICH